MIFIGAIIIIVMQNPQDEVESKVPPQPEKSTGSSDYGISCSACGWSGYYPTSTRAKQALGGHKRFCKGAMGNISPFAKPL